MRVAITTPTTWPHVRRGAERFLNELAAWLSARGHEVTVLSGKPGRGETVEMRGYKTVYYRRLWTPALAKIGLHEFHAFFLRVLPALLNGRYDVVHSITFLDAYAAILARRLTGTPCVYWVNSLPPPQSSFRYLTLVGAIYRRTMDQADEVIALSVYMQSVLKQRFGRQAVQLPVPVDLERFRFASTRHSSGPVILCASALDDDRK